MCVVEDLSCHIVWELYSPATGQPLHHFDLEPAPEDAVTLFSRLSMCHDDVEGLGQVVEVALPVGVTEACVGRVDAPDVVIAAVVGVDVDHLGQEIGGHEEMIFESSLPFGKTDVVLVQELWRNNLCGVRLSMIGESLMLH